MEGISEIGEKIKKEYDLKAKIMDMLNEFGSIVVKDYPYYKITENDFNILFELTNNGLRYIKEDLESRDPESFGNLVVFAFKSLFIGENDLKIDNLSQKKEYFDIILHYGKTGKLRKNLNNFIEALEKNVKITEKEKLLFQEIFIDRVVYLIYLWMLDNGLNLLDINEYWIKMVKSCFEVKLHFQYKALANVPRDEIIASLYQLFLIDKIDNYFHIYLKNNRIEIVKYSNDEISDYILSSDSQKNDKRKKKQK